MLKFKQDFKPGFSLVDLKKSFYVVFIRQIKSTKISLNPFQVIFLKKTTFILNKGR